MILYHVSFEPFVEEKTFYPRVPLSKAAREDAAIPRICFSDKIIRCLQAISDVVDKLCENDIITVFSFVADRNDTSLIAYTDLYNNSYVPDALLTHEYWYCSPIKLRAKRYKVTGFDEDYHYLVHEFQRDRLFDFIDNHYKLPDNLINRLKKISCSNILNVELYNEIYWEYGIDPADIADYLKCSTLTQITNLKVQHYK